MFNEAKVIKKSRKEHTCIQCFQKIPVGNSYTNHYGLFDGDWFNTHAHNECFKLWCNLNAAFGEDWQSVQDMMYDNKTPASMSFEDYQAEIKRRYGEYSNSSIPASLPS